MILLIGSESCSRCEAVKTILNNKYIQYEYKYMSEFNEEDKKKYLTMARKKGQLNLPIMIKDGEVIDYKEVI